MRSLLDKTLDLAFGAAAITRERAQEFVDDLVRRGEAAREESSSLVEDLLRRGQKQREELQAVVQREISDAMHRMSVATRDDLERLERRIQELETYIHDLRAAAGVGAEQPSVAAAPPEAPTAPAPGTTEPPSA